jgi:hypothetical protein
MRPYKHPHKDPGKSDDDLIEQTRHLFADPIPEMEVPGFGRKLAEIIRRGLRTVAKHLPGKLPGQHRDTTQSRPPGLMLRRTGLSVPAHGDQLDFEVIEDGRAIGRFYEDKNAPPELRWFWSITAFVGDRSGVATTGRAPNLELAKARFVEKWQKWRTDHSTQSSRPSI